MKEWKKPEIQNLALQETNEDVKCPYEAEGKSRCITDLFKKRCCKCHLAPCCRWPWKYNGSCQS